MDGLLVIDVSGVLSGSGDPGVSLVQHNFEGVYVVERVYFDYGKRV